MRPRSCIHHAQPPLPPTLGGCRVGGWVSHQAGNLSLEQGLFGLCSRSGGEVRDRCDHRAVARADDDRSPLPVDHERRRKEEVLGLEGLFGFGEDSCSDSIGLARDGRLLRGVK